MKNKFKGFFKKKEPLFEPPTVFRKPLQELALNSNGVPVFFEFVCLEIKKNVTSEGIFRKCGEKQKIEAIGQLAVNPNFSIPPMTDVNTLTSFLKQWLRELPEPILTPSIIKQHFNSTLLETVPIVLQYLNPVNRKCIAILFHLFKLICEKTEVNRMTMNNLIVCVIPSLLQSSKNPDFGACFSFTVFYDTAIPLVNDQGNDFDFSKQINQPGRFSTVQNRRPGISVNQNSMRRQPFGQNFEQQRRVPFVGDNSISIKMNSDNVGNFNTTFHVRNKVRIEANNTQKRKGTTLRYGDLDHFQPSKVCPLIGANDRSRLKSCPETMDLNLTEECISPSNSFDCLPPIYKNEPSDNSNKPSENTNEPSENPNEANESGQKTKDGGEDKPKSKSKVKKVKGRRKSKDHRSSEESKRQRSKEEENSLNDSQPKIVEEMPDKEENKENGGSENSENETREKVKEEMPENEENESHEKIKETLSEDENGSDKSSENESREKVKETPPEDEDE